MGLRDRYRQFKQDWQAAEQELARAEKRAAKSASGSTGQCNQRGCTRTATQDGVCGQCWTAIFG